MKKVLIAILCVITVIIISAIFILPQLVTMDKFRGRIETVLEASLHRKATLGDMGLALWPGIGAEIEDVRISNLSGFSKEDFVRIKSLRILIKILPLLIGNVKVDKCILVEPYVLIEKNGDGKFNFTDLFEKEERGTEERPGERRAKSKEKREIASIKWLVVSKAKVDNGVVHYFDWTKPEGREIYLNDIDLNLKDISLNRPIYMDLSFRLKETPGRVHAKGTFGPLSEDVDIMGAPLAIAFETKDLSLEPFNGFLGEGDTIEGLLNLHVKTQGKVNEVVNLKLDSSIKNLSSYRKERVFIKDMDVTISEEATLELKRGKATIQRGEISLGDLFIQMEGGVSDITSEPCLNINITTQDFPLSGWHETFPALDLINGLGGIGGINWSVQGPITSNLSLTGTTSLKHLTYLDKETGETMIRDLDIKIDHPLTLDIEGDLLRLKNLSLVLQEAPITINGKLRGLKGDLRMNLDISGQKVSLDKWQDTFPFLEQMVDVKGNVNFKADLKGMPDKLVDISFLLRSNQVEVNRTKRTRTVSGEKKRRVGVDKRKRAKSSGSIAERINLKGKVTIDRGSFEEIMFRNFTTRLIKKGSTLELNNMAFEIFEGKVKANGGINMAGKVPLYHSGAALTRIEVNKLYNTLASPKDLLFGSLNASFTASGTGANEEELIKNLKASGQLVLNHGRITSFNLLKEVALVANLLGLETHHNETRFDKLSMNFKIHEGKIVTDNLYLIGKDLKVSASGNVGLDKTMDLSVRMWLPIGHKFKINEEGEIIIPFHLGGTVLGPKVKLDTRHLF